MADQDTWVEMECPLTGVDQDESPAPPYGTEVRCLSCGQMHSLTEAIAEAYRTSEEGIVVITEEWRKK